VLIMSSAPYAAAQVWAALSPKVKAVQSTVIGLVGSHHRRCRYFCCRNQLALRPRGPWLRGQEVPA
jgi:hypothetical protein